MDKTRISPRIRAEMRRTARTGWITLIAGLSAFTTIGLGQLGVNEWWAMAILMVSVIVLAVMNSREKFREFTPPPPMVTPPGERRRRVAQLREAERQKRDLKKPPLT